MITSVTLICRAITGKNDNGYDIIAETSREVWADRVSVKRVEFYEAMRAGIEPNAVYRISYADYLDGEPAAISEDGVVYDVVRIYHDGGQNVEITVKKGGIAAS